MKLWETIRRELRRAEWWMIAAWLVTVAAVALGPQAPPESELLLYEVSAEEAREFESRMRSLESSVVEASSGKEGQQ